MLENSNENRVKRTQGGAAYIELNNEEIINKLHGLAICDSCNAKNMQNGYLIPILNSVYCKECFDKWASRSKLYSEDEAYELDKISAFSEVLGI